MTHIQQLNPINEFKMRCLTAKKSAPISDQSRDYCMLFIKKYSKEFKGTFCNDIQFVIKSFISRIKSSTYSSYKLYKYNKDPLLYEQIQSNKQFLLSLVTELIKGCYPGNSVTRILLYLDIINSIVLILGTTECLMPDGFDPLHCKTPEFPFTLEYLYPDELIMALLECLKSSFDSVRESCLQLLINHFLNRLDDKVNYITTQGNQLILSFRSNESKSGSMYLYLLNHLRPMTELNLQYFNNLTENIGILNNDLLLATKSNNIEGYLIYFTRLLVEKRMSIHFDDYYPLFKVVVHKTLPIVASACPEGNDFDYIHDSSSPASQLLLSFAWRNITLASNLLQQCMKSCTSSDSASIQLLFSEIVELAVNIRHRGAFANICPILSEMTIICKRLRLLHIPMDILQLYLREYIHKSDIITRRSAGIPQSIVALLTALDSVDTTIMVINTCNTTIYNHVTDGSVIHSMNILQSIFVESSFGASIFPLVGSGLKIAISNLGHYNWRIRNCSLMLFSTLVKRTCGSSVRTWTNGITSNEFFNRFDILHDVELALSSSYNTSIFACLLLQSRFKPSQSEEAFESLKPILESLTEHVDFKLRVYASRSLVLLIRDINPYLSRLYSFSNSLEKNINNSTHGQLCIILEYIRLNKKPVELDHESVRTLYSSCNSVNKSIIMTIYGELNTYPSYLVAEFHRLLNVNNQGILSSAVFDLYATRGDDQILEKISASCNSIYKQRMRYLIEQNLGIEQNHEEYFSQVPLEMKTKFSLKIDIKMIKLVQTSDLVPFIIKNFNEYEKELINNNIQISSELLMELRGLIVGASTTCKIKLILSGLLKWDNKYDDRILGAYALLAILRSSMHEDLKFDIVIECSWYSIMDEEPGIRELGKKIAEHYINVQELDEYEMYGYLLSKATSEKQSEIINEHLKCVNEQDTDALFATEYPNVYYEPIYFYSALKNILKLGQMTVEIPTDFTIRNDLYSRRRAVECLIK
eukprot:NODE_255_length_12751_cov_0.188587.p1 type:complete len:985 gc:universal NODE_255_length_12751_cov_0.188587:3326-6280(+)